MKTTIEIDDDLMVRAKARAAAERSSVRSLVEEALVDLLEKRETREPFVLAERSVAGGGMHPEVAARGWPAVAELLYGAERA